MLNFIRTTILIKVKFSESQVEFMQVHLIFKLIRLFI